MVKNTIYDFGILQARILTLAYQSRILVTPLAFDYMIRCLAITRSFVLVEHDSTLMNTNYAG